jgi:hypothetical protein
MFKNAPMFKRLKAQAKGKLQAAIRKNAQKTRSKPFLF